MGTGSDYGVAMGFDYGRCVIVSLAILRDSADSQYPGVQKAGGGELVMFVRDLT